MARVLVPAEVLSMLAKADWVSNYRIPW